MEKLVDLLGFGTAFICAGAVYGLFEWLDKNASKGAKASLAGTMRLGSYKSEQVAAALSEVFDRIFTDPLWSWRALLRSVFFTFVVTALYASRYQSLGSFLIELIRMVPPLDEYLDDPIGMHYLPFSWDITLYGSAFAVNALTDYLSLFVIRICLVRYGASPILALTLGSFLGLVIVFLGLALRVLAFLLNAMPYADESFHILPPLLETLFDTGTIRTAVPAMVVFIWLPLFALGILIIRALSPLSWLVERVQRFLVDGKKHPLRAIGCVAAVLVFVIGAGWHQFGPGPKTEPSKIEAD